MAVTELEREMGWREINEGFASPNIVTFYNIYFCYDSWSLGNNINYSCFFYLSLVGNFGCSTNYKSFNLNWCRLNFDSFFGFSKSIAQGN